MVLESLLSPFMVKRKPWEMFLAGSLYSVVALFVSYLAFAQVSGLLMVFLIVMSALPLVFLSIRKEEELDLKLDSEWKILQEHGKTLLFLLYFFLGVVAALTLLYIFLPAPMVETVFSIQGQAIAGVNKQVHPTGNIITNLELFGLFRQILLNNMRVLLFCLAFSFLFGVGALFILTWNASVVSAAIGNLIKTRIADLASSQGAVSLVQYFSVATFSYFRYMSHGIIEIAAYFVAGMAGGIISVAVIKHHLNNEHVIHDALDLFFISLGLLVLAAVVEVYITPAFFLS